MRISDWSSDVCSSDLVHRVRDLHRCEIAIKQMVPGRKIVWTVLDNHFSFTRDATEWTGTDIVFEITKSGDRTELRFTHLGLVPAYRSEEHTSELQSLMRISYAGFFLTKTT